MDVDKFNCLLEAGFSGPEAMQVSTGHRSHDDVLVDRQVRQGSSNWVGIPIQNWPSFEVRWNIEPVCYHRSLDGNSSDEFNTAYPDVVVMEACPHEIVAALPEASRRTKDTWDAEYKDKTAKVISAWSLGIGLTPPVLVPYGNGVVFAGGWHRFHVAMKKGVPTIKVLVRKTAIAAVKRAVPSHSVPTV